MPTPEKNPFDHTSRGLLKRARLALLCWLLKVAVSDVRWVTWLDTRLTVPGHPERECDTIAHIQRLDQGGFPWAIPVEFQAEPDALMLGRGHVYGGLIWLQEKPVEERGDRFDILPVIVNLTGRGKTGRRMAWSAGYEMTLLPIVWNFADLDAEAILDQIERDEAPYELLAWVSLMQKGGEPSIIQRWLQLAGKIEDPAVKADLALVELFADLTDRTEVWKQALEGFNVTESVTLNRWMDRAANAAAIRTKAAAVIDVLQTRFGPLAPEVKRKIEATETLDVLQGWIVLAASSRSLADFQRDAGL